MTLSFLKNLLPLLEEFQAEAGSEQLSEDAIPAFGAWLHARYTPGERMQAVAREEMNPLENHEIMLGKLVTFLYRYLRTYSRLALLDTPLMSFDEFTYLATAFGNGPLNKTELITRNIHEKPTGTEIIKRLLKAGLLQEMPHATDRRIRLLTITGAGQELLFRLFTSMGQVADMAAGNLAPGERAQLVHLLLKLDAFHFPIFAAARPESLEAMRARYFPHVTPWSPPTSVAVPGMKFQPPSENLPTEESSN